MNLLSVVALLWTFVGFGLISCQNPSFISPTSTGSYFINGDVEVEVNFPAGSPVNEVSIVQKCPVNPDNIAVADRDNPSITFPSPFGYFGPCTFELTKFADTSVVYTTVTIQISGLITIDALADNIIPANENVRVSWAIDPVVPPSPQTYTVTLTQPSSGLTWTETTIDTFIVFPVPSYFYASCQFSVSSDDYKTELPLNVYVTQQVTLLVPESLKTYSLSSSTLDVNYVTSGNTGITQETVTSDFNCQSLPTAIPVDFDINPTDLAYNYPPGSFGECSLTITHVSADYLTFTPNSPVIFYLKYTASFDNPPSTLYVLQSFNIKIKTDPVTSGDASKQTITLGMYCGPTTPIQTFDPILTNVDETLTLDKDVPIGTGLCTLKPTTTPNNVFTTDFSQDVSIAPLPIYFDESSQENYIQQSDFNFNSVSPIAGAVGSFDVIFTCSSLKEPISLPYTLGNVYSQPIPSNSYGDCELNVNNPAFLLNKALKISIKYQLSFSPIPANLYIGQPFKFTVTSSGTPPVGLTTTVQLACAGSLITTSWPSIIQFDVEYEVILPITLSPGSSCNLQTAASENYAQGISDTFTAINVPLSFALPTEQSYKKGEAIAIKVTTPIKPEISQSLNVHFICGTTIDDTIPVTTGVEIIYTPTNAFGECYISIPNPPQGFSAPADLTVTINWELSIDVASTIYVGFPFDIKVNPILPTDAPTVVGVKLLCDDSEVDSWPAVDIGITVELTTKNSLSTSTFCEFRTFSANAYIINAVSSTVALEKLALKFDQPTEGAVVIIPDPITIRVSTLPLTDPMPELPITVQLTCGSSEIDSDELSTNQDGELEYNPSDFNGLCSLDLSSFPDNVNPPTSDINFFLKFGLQFVDPPSLLKASVAFTIFISTSAQPPATLEKITLSLVCDLVLIQSWDMVDLNAQNTLTLNPSIPPFLSNCFLQTPSPNDYFTQASTPVTIETMNSPFGGNLYPITPEQLKEFISTLPIIPGIPVVPLSSNF